MSSLTERIVEIQSPNKSARAHRSIVNALILHDTDSKTAKAALDWFRDESSKVSSHYVVGKDGTIYRCVPEAEKAWHAGESSLFGEEDVNEFSIGIEIVNDEANDPYVEEQLTALFELCEDIIYRYKIPMNRIVGHRDIAVPHGRKIDPVNFPWFDFLLTLASRVTEKELSGE